MNRFARLILGLVVILIVVVGSVIFTRYGEKPDEPVPGSRFEPGLPEWGPDLPAGSEQTSAAALSAASSPALIQAPTAAPQRTGSLKVRVVDGNGAGLARATVLWALSSEEEKTEPVRTDATGEVRIASLPPGTYVVSAVMPGFLPMRGIRAKVKASEVAELILQLDPGATVRGRVVENVSGKPLPGASVSATRAMEAEEGPVPVVTESVEIETRPDEDGRFNLSALQPGEDYSISASLTGYITVTKEIQGATDQGIDFALDRGGSIEGMGRNSAGAPVSGATVSLLNPSKEVFVQLPSGPRRKPGRTYVLHDQFVTDPEGKFQFLGLDTGEFFLKAWKDDLVTVDEPDPRPVEVTRGMRTGGLVLDLRAGGTLQARVMEHSSGEPVAGVEFRIRSIRYPAVTGIPRREGETDGAGLLFVSGLDRGPQLVELTRKAYRFHSEKEPEFEVSPGTTHEMEIVLEIAAVIAGTVLSPDDRPVANAGIRVLEPRRDGQFQRGRGISDQRTGADGMFRVEGLKRDATYTVTASAEGYSPEQVPDVPAGTEDLEIRLDPPGSISGKVVGAAGQPIENARVEAHLRQEKPGWYWPQRFTNDTETDAAGRYSISGLGEGEHDVRASVEGFAPRLKKGVPVALGKETGGVDFILDAGYSISGEVFVKGTTAGVAGVSITAKSADFPDKTAETGASGDYAFENLSPGTYGVRLALERDKERRYVAAEGALARKVTITDEDVAGIDFELVPGGIVRGHVFSPQDQPVSGAGVSLSSSRFPFDQDSFSALSWSRSVESGGDGAYEIVGVPAGSGRMVMAAHEGYAPTRSAPFDIEEGEEKEGIDVRLTEGGSVSGKVMDEEKKPIEGAFVNVANMGMLDFTRVTGPEEHTTDAEGRYRIDHLPEGKIILSARLKGEHTSLERSAMRTIDVREGEEVTNVDFILKKKEKKFDATISGVVMNEQGEGVGGCMVMASMKGQGISMEREGRHDSTRTAEDGTFTLKNLRPGTFQVRAMMAQGYAQDDGVEVEAPAEDVEIILQRTGSVAGTVVSGETREPVETFSASLESEAGTAVGFQVLSQRGQAFQSPDGAFEIDNVQPGAYRAVAEAKGYGVGKSEPFEVAPGEEVTGIVVVLRRGGAIVGIVADQTTYEPIAGAGVTYAPETASGFQARFLPGVRQAETSTTTDESGTFIIEGLSPGKGSIRVEHPDYAPKEVDDVEVGETGPAEVTILLSAGGAIAGTVKGPDRQPLGGRTVMAQANDTMQMFSALRRAAQAVTDSLGEYRIDHLVPGSYTVSVGEGMAAFLAGFDSKPAQVREGETTRVNFGGYSGAVHGTVTEAGIPAPGFQVSLTTSKGPVAFFGGRSAVVDESGMYRIEDIPPGEIEITLQRPAAPMPKVIRTVNATMPPEGDLRVDLEVPLGRVAGIVAARSSGEPINGARVILSPVLEGDLMVTRMFFMKEMITGEDGAFAIDGVCGGVHRLEAAASGYGYESRRLELAEGESRTGIRLALPGPGTLAGHVTFPEAMAATSRAVAFYVMPSDGAANEFLSVVSGHQSLDANGDYRIEGLAPGTYAVSAQVHQLPVVTHAGIRISEGQTTVLDIDFRTGIEVVLYVKDPDGQPVYESTATILDPNGLPVLWNWFGLPSVRQDVIIANLLREAYTLIVEKDGYKRTEEILDLSGVEEEYRGEVVLVPE